MTDEQMNSINAQFSEMRAGFAQVEGRLDRVDEQLDRVDERLDRLDGRLDRMDGRLGTVEGSLAQLKAQVSANEATLNRVDAEVHRQGLLVEERHEELKLGIEAFQTTQRVTNEKIDLVRQAVEDRLVPLELATRTHASTLADHSRRLEAADGQA